MPCARRQAGSLLIISLWLVTILSVLAVAIGRYLSTEVRLARYQVAHARALALARGGVYVAIAVLKADAEDQNEHHDWLGDDWARLGAGTAQEDTWVAEWLQDAAQSDSGLERVEVTISDEERKLNVNAVPSDMSSPLFKALETLLASHEAAIALVDWMDDNDVPWDLTRPTTEADETTGWVAKNAPAGRLEELFTIPGLRDVSRATIASMLSVYCPPGDKLNVNTVEPAVMEALGLRALAAALVDCRRRGVIFEDTANFVPTAENCLGGGSGLPTEEQNLLTPSLFGVTSETFTVVSRGIVTEGIGGASRPPVQVTVEAVVRRSECDPAPAPCIIAWSAS